VIRTLARPLRRLSVGLAVNGRTVPELQAKVLPSALGLFVQLG
jgi:hypothetical protein